MKSRVLLLILPLLSTAAAAQDESARPKSSTCPRLAIAGFSPAEGTDARDTWLAVAVEEFLAERLRRVPGLITIPTVRLHQARAELQGPDKKPPSWERVVRGLGATWHVRGTCAGYADRLELTLALSPTSNPQSASEHTIGPDRFNAVLNAATTWLLTQLEALPPGDEQRDQLTKSPSTSLSAVEYYARGLSSLRVSDLRNAARYTSQAISSDGRLRPALALQARISTAARVYSDAQATYRMLAHEARRANDDLDRARAELGQALVAQVNGGFHAAHTRVETALQIADELHDPYVRIAAANTMADLYLTRKLPTTSGDRSPEQLQQQARDNLNAAVTWLNRLIDLLAEQHDQIGALPAINRLALVYERLGRYDDAIATHQRMLKLAEQLASRPHQATAWLYLGQCYRQQDRLDDAQRALQRCLALVGEEAEAGVRIVLGSLLLDADRPADARKELEAAYKKLRDGTDLPNQFACLRQLATARLESGDRAAAIQALQEALDIAVVLELAEAPAVREQLESWKAAN